MTAADRDDTMRERVERAGTAAEVVAAISEYMQAWTRQDFDRLPRFNRPGPVDDAEAVQRWADQLSRYRPAASQDPMNNALFTSLRDCFGRASQRIAEIGAAIPNPG